jgi:signal transduction histidine kinase
MTDRDGLFLTLKMLLEERERLVSHALRTPLTVIRGFVELILALERGKLPELAQEGLEIVIQNTKKLEQSVSRLEVILEEAAMTKESLPSKSIAARHLSIRGDPSY